MPKQSNEDEDLALVPAVANMPAVPIVSSAPPEGSLLSTVMGLMSSPQVLEDPSRLREVIAAAKELDAMEAKRVYSLAFAQLQRELPSIPKNGLIPKKKGKAIPFAKWDDIYRAVHPLLIKHGFAARFTTDNELHGQTIKLKVTLTLSHIRGHEESSSWTLPVLGDNAFVSNLQNAASPVTFGKRYVFCNMLNILTEGVDNDGANEIPPEPITEEQLDTLRNILNACQDKEKGSLGKFRQWVKAEFDVNDPKDLLQGEQLDAVMKHLEQRQKELGLLRR